MQVENQGPVRRPGLAEAIRLNLWRLRTYISKRYLLWQDRTARFTYPDWIRQNEGLNAGEGVDSPPPGQTPRFSIVIPLIGGDVDAENLLSFTLNSIVNQRCRDWEAWVVSEGRLPDQTTLPQDERIHFVQAAADPPCAGTWNLIRRGVEQARGEFALWLEPGDSLSVDLFAAVDQRLKQSAGADLIYWDEDQLSPDGPGRENPFFKPDWSPDLMLSTNYLGRALARTELLRRPGPASYVDALFRCIEQGAKVEHIPQVLFHARPGARENCEAHASAVKAHLERRGLREVTVTTTGGALRVRWAQSAALASIIIPTRDHYAEIERCISSIQRLTRYPSYELILMDNGSVKPETRRYYDELRKQDGAAIYTTPQPFNFSAALNQGAAKARGDLLLFLNNDVEIIDADWLDELAQWAARPEIGVVGGRLLYPDHTIQHAGLILGLEGYASHVFMGLPEHSTGVFGSTDWYRDYAALNGACILLRREVFEQAGGFDEAYHLVFSDIKLGVEVSKLGYRNLYNPFARLVHYEGKSRGKAIPREDVRTGYPYFRELIQKGDPYYNPHLSSALRIPTFARRGEETALERIDKIVRLKG